MKVKEFQYTDSKGQTTGKKVAVMTESGEVVQGMDLSKLTAEERQSFFEIQSQYEENLQPFMKAFRRYNKPNITEEITHRTSDLQSFLVAVRG